ncbi:MAG: T9SS type A sorting domain-containing protein [Aureispira sp.]|nr:T9SS type A sorting domain-containing protein [Aureispira sp.]
MKKLLHIFSFFIFINAITAQTWEVNPNTNYNSYFEEAYQQNPLIPKGILESIAYTRTHIRHIEPQNEEPSCVQLPAMHGVMGLMEDGTGYFRNSLQVVADLSGYEAEVIKADARLNILAFAKAYSKLQTNYNLSSSSPETQIQILDALSELPTDDEALLNFAFDSYVYSIFKNLNSPKFQGAYKLPKYNIDLEKVFGEDNYKILSAGQLKTNGSSISRVDNGQTYRPQGSSRAAPPCSDLSGGFPYTVIQDAADPSNYNSRSGTPISAVTIHTMQGYYSGAISWFKNPIANVSAHYNMRSSDGQITQMVCEIDRAWHVGNSNSLAVGIEHEGYVSDPSWYTNITYVVSAELTKDIATRNGIPIIRTYDVIGDAVVNELSTNCYRIKGHQHFPSQSHTDPGEFWDWNYYYDLLNPAGAAPSSSFTTCTGSFTDSGGAGTNYGNDERIFYRIEPTGATSVTLTFSAFNVEANYDYLYVYDGDSENDPLLAVLDGTTMPSAITANSGKMFLEFRTDCGTTASGWEASWTCSTVAPSCAMPTALSETNQTHNTARLQWTGTAPNYEVKFKRSLDGTWTTYYTSNAYQDVQGLASGARYFWSVRAICAVGDTSIAHSREFINGVTNDITVDLCSGRFTDTGGELGGYRDDEDYTYTIAPTGAQEVTLVFSSFNLETNFDYMYFYDGPTTASPQIGGAYTGTTSPGTIVAPSGILTIRFTSDNRTTRAGWVADWTCDSGLPTYPSPILLDTTMAGNLDCGLTYHAFYDSGGSLGTYENNEDYTQTFCNPDPTKAIRLSFRPDPTEHLSMNSTTIGNDYLYIYNGPDDNSNLVGVYTGASSASPQPGSFVSTEGCVTVKIKTDASDLGLGWSARLYCVDRPTIGSAINVGGAAGDQAFTDSGGAGGSYGNNESYIITYQPDPSAPAGEVVWAEFNGASNIERNWDYLYVYDGPNTNARLINVYTGDASNVNTLGTIKATTANSSGALTFQFFSDGATVATGWEANMTTGTPRFDYGSNACSGATAITSVGEPYAGSTMLATGEPGSPDPDLNISIATLPECSGINTITRLENTVWYKFQTPTQLCTATELNVNFDNISCQSDVPSGAGMQFVLYESSACRNGSSWGAPVYCADKLRNGDNVDILGYLNVNTTYYMMVDGFAGQHCNFDVTLEAVTVGDPNDCVFPLDLLEFKGRPDHDHVDLTWETANEHNVAGFTVQRAMPNGVDFEDIGYVESTTTHISQSASYAFEDYDYYRNKVNYYRLKEVDRDGSTMNHNVISVDMRERGDLENLVDVYPNPAQNTVTFSMSSLWKGNYNLLIYDMTGKQIYQTEGSIDVGFWKEELNISHLPQGMYMYQLRFGTIAKSGRFEKM